MCLSTTHWKFGLDKKCTTSFISQFSAFCVYMFRIILTTSSGRINPWTHYGGGRGAGRIQPVPFNTSDSLQAYGYETGAPRNVVLWSQFVSHRLTDSVHFIVSLSTRASSGLKCESVKTSRDSCGTQAHNKWNAFIWATFLTAIWYSQCI